VALRLGGAGYGLHSTSVQMPKVTLPWRSRQSPRRWPALPCWPICGTASCLLMTAITVTDGPHGHCHACRHHGAHSTYGDEAAHCLKLNWSPLSPTMLLTSLFITLTRRPSHYVASDSLRVPSLLLNGTHQTQNAEPRETHAPRDSPLVCLDVWTRLTRHTVQPLASGYPTTYAYLMQAVRKLKAELLARQLHQTSR
jgi:hypothetical protein